MITLRNIIEITNIKNVIGDEILIKEIRANVQNGDVYIARNVFSEDLILRIRKYLVKVGQSSIPNYQKIELGAPNFHRMNQVDPRAYVKGCFHQFVFFPWNQDYFNLFELSKEVYFLKNLISNLPADKFLKSEPEDGCTSRLAVQFYPQGQGFLNKHRDPVDHHQLTVPIMIMSKKGVDFQSGGAYVEKENGEKVILDDICNIGDVIFFNAHMAHGVEKIDPETKTEWLDFKGRWMLLFAVNKLFSNTTISDAVDLDKNDK